MLGVGPRMPIWSHYCFGGFGVVRVLGVLGRKAASHTKRLASCVASTQSEYTSTGCRQVKQNSLSLSAPNRKSQSPQIAGIFPISPGKVQMGALKRQLVHNRLQLCTFVTFCDFGVAKNDGIAFGVHLLIWYSYLALAMLRPRPNQLVCPTV